MQVKIETEEGPSGCCWSGLVITDLIWNQNFVVQRGWLRRF